VQLKFNVYQPRQFRDVLGLAAIPSLSSKQLNGDQAKSKPNQIQHKCNRCRKQAIRRNSRLSKNRVTRSTVHYASRPGNQIEQLDRLYRFRNREEVINFIQENPSLFQLLRDVYHKAQHYFGAGVEIVLDVFTDHEVPTHRELIALVQTTLPISEALTHLDRLYQEWWVEASAAVPLKMSIDVESI
jgi:hypothetical protein